jgi:hypothetical protein
VTPDVSAYILNSIPEGKQRNIFALLASVEPKPVTRLTLSEAVWHEDVPLNAYAKIRSTVIDLNSRLVLFGWRIESYVPEVGTGYNVQKVYYRLERVK